MNAEPDIIKHIELIAASIGVIIGLFFGTFLILTKSQRPVANIFLAIFLIAFSLRLGKSLFHNYFYVSPGVRNFFLAGLLAFGPSIWLYVKHVFKPQTNHNTNHIIFHYLLTITFMVFSWIIPNDQSALARWIFFGLLIHMLIYSVYTIIWLVLNITTVKEIPINNLRKWLVFISGIAFILAAISMAVFWGWVPYLSTAFLFSISMLFMSGWALKHPAIFSKPIQKYTSSFLSDEKASAHLEKLEQLMLKDKLYLDPALTLSTLSQKMHTTSKQLSQIINQFHQENYSQFVARHRVEEAKKMLTSKDYLHFKITAIAYECGFTSISSFNAAFKKYTGTTAQKFRQEQLKTS